VIDFPRLDSTLRRMLFELVQVVYWLALSSWFGGALFIASAAQIIYRTLQVEKPILPHVLSVNLEGKHSVLLHGAITGNLMSMLSRWGVIAGILLAATIIAQWTMLDVNNSAVRLSLFMRSAMLLGAIGVVVFDSRVVWPKVWKYRQEFIENADEPEKANPALEEFERYQRESYLLLNVLVFCLLGIVLFSGGISHTFTVTAGS
jgi:hypothetical protein